MISNDENPFPSGSDVRLRANPAMQGVTTRKEQTIGGRLRFQVAWDNGKRQYQKIDDLELLPDMLDDWPTVIDKGTYYPPEALRAILTYQRLNGRLDNLIYSMETTNTEFLAYQFRPVLNLLDSPNYGLLIADEVGLGKTIEAGLIWTELRSRFDYKKLMVVCPAMLTEKWVMELDNRFGIDAISCSASEVKQQLERAGKNKNKSMAIVTSLQGISPKRGWNNNDESNDSKRNNFARYLRDNDSNERLIDLLVIDGAHMLRNRGTTYHDIATLLKNVTSHIVLLSATPVHLKSDDLFSLLKLVDEFTFESKNDFENMLAANEPLLSARREIMKKSWTYKSSGTPGTSESASST